jgi:exosortase E/protease (VPEID-CTERM system)
MSWNSANADPTAAAGNSADPLPRPPYFRWAVLSIALIAEFIGISMGYDAADRWGESGWAAFVISRSPKVIRVAFVAGLAIAVLAGLYLWTDIRNASRRQSNLVGWLFAVAHSAAFGLFALSTERILGAIYLEAPIADWYMVAWLATGVVTGGLWAAAILPPQSWCGLAWRGRGVTVAGLVIAGGGLLVAQVFQEGWDVLAQPTLWLSHQFLTVFAADIVYEPEARLLGTKSFSVYVTQPCSGYEGMGLMCAFLAGYLWLLRRDLRFPWAFLLFPLGLVAIWLVNALRIALLILIGGRISPSLAMGGFHSQAGWLGFSAVALAIVWVSYRSHLFARSPATPDRAEANPTAAFLAPLLAALAVQMMAAAFSPRPEEWYPLRVALAAMFLFAYWSSYFPRTSDFRLNSLWGIAVGIGVFVLWVAFDRLIPSDGNPSGPASIIAEWSIWSANFWLVAWVIGYVVVTPIIEERAFRGYLMRRLIAADFEEVPTGSFTWLSFLVSSVAFGLLHGQWLAGTLAGMAYAGVIYRTGRLRDAIIAHAVTNGLLVVLGFTTGHWTA